ncbi:DUF2069 domain-containing protein [Aliikangiella sp. G2MR2-5]|uniref:DUF2069 domain-containing protein n=1 Tax=Aliikangiella sp. G2MR2-5 TaxID=2788943 RepID=UPI0018A9A064|nr:DUF2069 domain-containing protein [Aliikangiella sp. G2MR2-5]
MSEIESTDNKTIQAPTEQMLFAHRVTLAGYFGLIVFIPFWNLIWFPSPQFNNSVITGFWLVPLLFPLIGLVKGKAYTHAWSGFIAVIYVCHALASFITHLAEWPAIVIELILANMFLFGGMYFAKWRGEQLGLQLPKKKK